MRPPFVVRKKALIKVLKGSIEARLLRGGSWFFRAGDSARHYRARSAQGYSGTDYGLRVCSRWTKSLSAIIW